MRLLDRVAGHDVIAAGFVVSLVATAVALVTLWRLTADTLGDAAGGRAVLYLVLTPYAVFLAAVYSESLFLAFAIPAWLAATRGRGGPARLPAPGGVPGPDN